MAWSCGARARHGRGIHGRADRRGGERARGGAGREDDDGGADTCPFSFSNFLNFPAAAVSRILFGIKPTSIFMKIFVELGEDKI